MKETKTKAASLTPRVLFVGAYVLSAAALMTKLALKTSSEPFVADRYSLPYFIFLVLTALVLTAAGFLFARSSWKPETLRVLFRGGLALLFLFGGVEIAAALDQWLHPRNQVLFLQADRVLGWRSVPNFKWLSDSGNGEYRAWIHTNSRGFHDREHSLVKPPLVRRAVVLGDSFIEAVQLPLEKTAFSMLEASLNKEKSAADRAWEVLNGGISNYGLGQMYLLWKHEFRSAGPDVLFVLLSGRILNATVNRFETAAFGKNKGRELWVRPVFEDEKGTLVLREARDHEEFRVSQNQLIAQNDGSRVFKARREGLFLQQVLMDYWNQFDRHVIRKLNRAQRRMLQDTDEEVRSQVLDINLKLLRQWRAELAADGTRMVLVDLSRFMDTRSRLNPVFQDFAERETIGYIALDQLLVKASESGLIRFKADGHLNESGHRVFSQAMADWLREHAV